MATYKVLQDIESEDKLLGPLSLKQLIFAFIAVGLIFMMFRILTATALGVVRWPLLSFFLLPTILFSVLAAPLGRDQPTETWLLAKIRFFLKPRKRVWDQNGPKELVTITAPKKLERKLTKDFSEHEVRSRLDALANVMDSRGWAVKNVNVNLNDQTPYFYQDDDRLLDPLTLPQEVQTTDVQASDDILDISNRTAQQFESMIVQAEAKHQESLKQQIVDARQHRSQQANPMSEADSWFNQQAAGRPAEPVMNGGRGQSFRPSPTPAPVVPTVAAPSQLDEAALLDKIHEKQAQQAAAGGGMGHLKTLQPLGSSPVSTAPPTTEPVQAPLAQPAADPAIVNLAQDNDKTVATIAREAKKYTETRLDDGEVVVSLH